MDVNKYLIMIKNEDKTEDIISYENNKHLINIKYKSTEKIYSYLRRDFQFYKNPTKIDIKDQRIILNQGYVYNVIKILKFESICKLFFEDGTSVVVPGYSLQLVKNNEPQTLSINKFDYYKDISKVVSVRTEEGKSLLTDEYEGINFISNDTALYKYLNPKTGISKMNVNLNNIIFPFGANKSQFQAVKNAMSSQISIIEGPPGTGKTQTILNIIANIVKNGQTVAVVSNNNAATDNVYEKLQKYNLDYLCARLGKRENKEEFINNQIGQYPKFGDKLEDEYSTQNEILELNQSITKILDIQNNIAKLREELNEIKLQHQYFNKHHDNNINIPKIRNIKKVTSKIIMKLKVEYEELQEINLWFRIKSQFLYGIGKKDFYKRERKDIINCYNRLFFIVKEMELENTIKNNILGNINSEIQRREFNELKLQNELYQLHFQQQKHELWMLGIITALLSVGFIAFFFYQREKKERLQQENLLLHKEAELSGLREKEIRQRNKEAELREALFRRISFFHKLPSLHTDDKQDESAANSKIVVTNTEWAEVISVVNDAFDNFVVRLQQAYPSLGEKEIGFCCLVKINVNIQDLSDIYCISKAAITKRKYRIKTDKLGITDENISLDSFLKAF